MNHWKVDLKHPELAALYDEYLHAQERLLTFYLGSLVLSKHADLQGEHPDTPIRASSDFEDGATSIRTIGQIGALVEDGTYDQLSRSFAVIGMVTALGDLLGGVRQLLALDLTEVKKTVIVKHPPRPDVAIKAAALKIAHLTNVTFNLDSRICDYYASRWINCITKLRHMFVHDKGLFNLSYKPDMINEWAALKAGDPIMFNENAVDSILWFFNDHARDFISRLDEKIAPGQP